MNSTRTLGSEASRLLILFDHLLTPITAGNEKKSCISDGMDIEDTSVLFGHLAKVLQTPTTDLPDERFKLATKLDYPSSSALDRCIKILNSPHAADMYVLRDVGLCMMYILTAYEKVRRVDLINTGSGTFINDEFCVQHENDKIVNAVSHILMVADTITCIPPTRSTIHHVLFLFSVSMGNSSNAAILRPYTMSCLFQWTDNHWNAIRAQSDANETPYSSQAIMALSFFAVDRTHDRNILEWLWTIVDGVDAWKSLVQNIASLKLTSKIEAIYENLSDLTDDIELMSKAFEYATCSSKIQIFSQSRNGCQILAELALIISSAPKAINTLLMIAICAITWYSIQLDLFLDNPSSNALTTAVWTMCIKWMEIPEKIPKHWHRTVLYMAVALANAHISTYFSSQILQVNLGDSVSTNTDATSNALLQAIQLCYVPHQLNDADLDYEDFEQNPNSELQVKYATDLITHINHALLIISVDVSLAYRYANTPMLIESLLMMASTDEHCVVVQDYSSIQTAVVFFLETLLSVHHVEPFERSDAAEPHMQVEYIKLQESICTRIAKSGMACKHAIGALRIGAISSIFGWLRLFIIVYRTVLLSDLQPVSLSIRKMYSELWRELISSLLRGLPSGCSQVIVDVMEVLIDHINPSCQLAEYLIDNRWCLFVMEVALTNMLRIEGHWKWVLSLVRLLLVPKKIRARPYVCAWITTFGLLSILQTGPYHCVEFEKAAGELVKQIMKRYGQLQSKSESNQDAQNIPLDTLSEGNEADMDRIGDRECIRIRVNVVRDQYDHVVIDIRPAAKEQTGQTGQ
ncbi:hypothetical protein O5D80_002351 [Batrachochytrium dendrobatidis]|nr:hypothetical protein O5D80_002351 [Batrachochytrium dendrobatidis]